jgi:hypothetical protein
MKKLFTTLCALLIHLPALAQTCDAQDWFEYKGVKVRKIPGEIAYFYITDRMAIDADGAPNAYHPQDVGIDALANAGYPSGNWQSIIVPDPKKPAQPYTQPDGPFKGYFVSMTTLKDKSLPITATARYVDATTVPYLVFPSTFWKIKGTGDFGDFAVARSLENSTETSAIVADAAGDKPLGEVSIKFAETLSNKKVNPRNGAGMPTGKFVVIVFPKSKKTPAWPVSNSDIQVRTSELLTSIGGWDRALKCLQ